MKANIGILFSMLYQSPWANSGWGNNSSTPNTWANSPWGNSSTPAWSNAWTDTGVGTWRDSPTWKDSVVWTNAPWSNQAPDVVSPTWKNTGTTTPTLPTWSNAPGVIPVPTWMDTSKPIVAPVWNDAPVVVTPPPIVTPIQAPATPIGSNPFLDPINAGWKDLIPTFGTTPYVAPVPGKLQPPAITMPGSGGTGYYTSPTVTPKPTPAYQPPMEMGIGGGVVNKVIDIFGGVTRRVVDVLPTSITNMFGVAPTTKQTIDMSNWPTMEQATGMKPPSLFQTRPMTPEEITQYNRDIIAKQEARFAGHTGFEKFVEYSRMPGELIDIYASKSTLFGEPLAGKDLIRIPKSLTGWETDWKFTVPTQKQAEEAFISKRAQLITELTDIEKRPTFEKITGGVGYGLSTAPAQVGIAVIGGALLGKAIPMAGAVSRIGAARYATNLATAEGGIGLGIAKAASKYVVTPATTYAEPLMNLAGAGYVVHEVKKAGTVEGGLTVGTGIYEGAKFGAAYKGFKATYEPTLKSFKGIEGINALSKTTKPLDVVEASIAGKAKFTGDTPSNMYGRPITPPSGKSLTVLDKEIAGQSRWTTGIGGKGEAPSNYPKAPGRFGFTDIFGKVSGKVESVGDVRVLRSSEYGYGNRIIENPFEGFGDVVGKTVVGVGKGVGGISEIAMPAFGSGIIRDISSELTARKGYIYAPEISRPKIDAFGNFVDKTEVGITSPVFGGTEVGKDVFGGGYGGKYGGGYGGRYGGGYETPISNPFINPGKTPNVYPPVYQNPNKNPFITPGETSYKNPFVNPNENPVSNPFINPNENPTGHENPFINPNENPYVFPTVNQFGKGGYPPKFGFVPPLAGGPGGGGGGGGKGASFFGKTKYHPISETILGKQVQEAPRRQRQMTFSGGQAQAGRAKHQRNAMPSIGQQVVNEAFGMGSKKGRRKR